MPTVTKGGSVSVTLPVYAGYSNPEPVVDHWYIYSDPSFSTLVASDALPDGWSVSGYPALTPSTLSDSIDVDVFAPLDAPDGTYSVWVERGTFIEENTPPDYGVVNRIGDTFTVSGTADGQDDCADGWTWNPESGVCEVDPDPDVCSYEVSPESYDIPFEETPVPVGVITNLGDCVWGADSMSLWIGGNSYEVAGSGVAEYTALRNLGPARTGTIRVSEGGLEGSIHHDVTVNQAGPEGQEDCPDGYVWNPETDTCDPVTGPTDVTWPFDGICEGLKTTLTWSEVEGAESYRVERQGPGDADFLPIGNTTDLFFIDTDVTIGLEYDYRVIAEFDTYESLPSETLTVEPCTGFITTEPTESPTGTETLCTGQAEGFTAHCTGQASGYEVVETY